MSLTSSAEQTSRTDGADAHDAYDGGGDWGIGLGALIIDLEADLEADRRGSSVGEMNRVASAKIHVGVLPPDAPPSPSAPDFCAEPRRAKERRRSPCASARAVPKVYITKPREPQGRPGEAFAMHPNPGDANAPCAKGKEGKRGRSQGRAPRRERDCVRTRKEAHGDAFECDHARAFGKPERSACYCSADTERGAMEAQWVRAAPFVVEEDGESCEPGHRTLSIKTRSVGTNTQEFERSTESDCMEPCQPGTSVNLEGIVWHETEEGVLVVNVTWRKRTYVGTLLDCTKHDWAPPRFCESPTSDSEMTCGRGRGKRMRISVSDQPVTDPGFSKIRGLSHKKRGMGIGSKGRRGSLTHSSCRNPAYYSVEDIKSSALLCGKRKSKAPADLDLSLVSDDSRTGNGKRIRAKSRSAPSTPQGKSDPAFLDQVCTSPMLIDCPHPNCNKKYKHINGLRYHQSHAHLDNEIKQDFEAESEDRLSDYDESLGNAALDSGDNIDIIIKKPRTIYKLHSNGSPKSRKLMLSSDHGPPNSKARRNVVGKEGPGDDFNLPLISNMSVVLENCLIGDRNSSIEMPKLEAEGIIDKREAQKENGLADNCSAKTRTNRFIVTAPAPPKLIAIPTFPATVADESSHLSKPKNIPLKPIKPKLDIVTQVNISNSTISLSKESKRKEKHKLKNRPHKDPRSPKTETVFPKAEDVKSISKDLPISLLKEHLSKQELVGGLTETQGSRMASIRAEADKVYTFTDNAPSPSIGSSARMDSGTLLNGDGNTKTNSPAYSDISDVTEDGGLNPRTRRNSAPDFNLNGSLGSKVALMPGKETQSSAHGHGYESYSLSGYVHTDPTNPALLKASAPYVSAKEDARVFSDEQKALESSADSISQLAMTQAQTALAQSLYYGQYTRNGPTDHKALIAGNPHRQQANACYDNKHGRSQGRRGAEAKERTKEDSKQTLTAVASHKGASSGKISCAKPGFIYVELDKQLSLHQPQGKPMSGTKDQGLNKESEDFNPESQNAKSNADTNVTYLNASESQSWSNPFQTKYAKPQNQEVNKLSQETGAEKEKEWRLSPEPESECQTPSEEFGARDRSELDKVSDETSDDSQGVTAAVSSSQQPYVQYQHSYPYLHLCESSNTSFSVMSPTVMPNYPGFHYPLYGKTAEKEESVGMQSGKNLPETADLELLPHHLTYHNKTPAAVERGGTDEEREREAVPFAHHLHTHHHTHLGMSYTLVSGQYDPFQSQKKS